MIWELWAWACNNKKKVTNVISKNMLMIDEEGAGVGVSATHRAEFPAPPVV